jgi:hypothetical protein
MERLRHPVLLPSSDAQSQRDHPNLGLRYKSVLLRDMRGKRDGKAIGVVSTATFHKVNSGRYFNHTVHSKSPFSKTLA